MHYFFMISADGNSGLLREGIGRYGFQEDGFYQRKGFLQRKVKALNMIRGLVLN